MPGFEQVNVWYNCVTVISSVQNRLPIRPSVPHSESEKHSIGRFSHEALIFPEFTQISSVLTLPSLQSKFSSQRAQFP